MHGVPGLIGFPFECLSEPVNRRLKTFFKRNLGFPAKSLPGKINDRLTLEWIVLGEGLVDQFQVGIDAIAYEFRQLANGEFIGVANVDRAGFVAIH